MENTTGKTNEKFNRLTNLDISKHHRDKDYWLMVTDFTGAFGYWVICQGPKSHVFDLYPSLLAFDSYVKSLFKNTQLPQLFTYEDVENIVCEEKLAGIREILKLNELDDEFIDLYALARNVKFMILREFITQA